MDGEDHSIISADVGLPVDDVLEIEFDPPIEYANVKYDRLTFREPTAGQLYKALKESGPAMATTLSLAQQTAGVPMRVIEGMTARQFQKVDRFFSRILNENAE